MMTTEDELRAEVVRGTRRVKMLERRIQVIVDIAEGRRPRAAEVLLAVGVPPRPAEATLSAVGQPLNDEQKLSFDNHGGSYTFDAPLPADGRPQNPFENAPTSSKDEVPNPFASPPKSRFRKKVRVPPLSLLEEVLASVAHTVGVRAAREAMQAPRDPLGKAPREHSADVEAVERFAQAMIDKLDKNAHKAHWGETHEQQLLCRLREEVEELSEALRDEVEEQDPFSESARLADAKVCDEAVDVANFAMMIFDNYSRRSSQ